MAVTSSRFAVYKPDNCLAGRRGGGSTGAMAWCALFAGSFDPITNGHLDVVASAVRLADRLVLAVGVHPGKTPLFPTEERLAMLEEICTPLGRAAGCIIACTTFAGLVVEAARHEGATILVRGVR